MIEPNARVLGIRIDVISLNEASAKIVQLARNGYEYVCAANVHMIMESYDNPSFEAVVNSATLVVPDGKPLVWALRLLGLKHVERVTGSSLTIRILEEAQAHGICVGFYGGQEEVLELLIERVRKEYPALKINYAFSPPFRPISDTEERMVVKNIVDSAVKILFVGLGCPKQERWMASHSDRIPAVMIGVGAVFDFLAGAKPRAPRLLQEIGLEWLFRLVLEPRRLWRRYLIENPRFIVKFFGQLLGLSKY